MRDALGPASGQAGWLGTAEEFLATPREQFVRRLRDFINYDVNMPTSRSQVESWYNIYDILLSMVQLWSSTNANLRFIHFLFEYCIPRERGRRVDLVVLTNRHLDIIEFKGDSTIRAEYVAQLESYRRDISEYHSAAQHLNVRASLVLSAGVHYPKQLRHLTVYDRSSFVTQYSIRNLAVSPPVVPADKWVLGEYRPLPTLVSAARAIFERLPLPTINRAASNQLPQALSAIRAIVNDSRRQNTRALIFVTGVPGSGKTLLGLKAAYDDYGDPTGATRGVLLSGNGPLIDVLQHSLRSKIFVQDVHAFIKTYNQRKRKRPPEHVIIFDEAQRAWDREQVVKRREGMASEPEDLLNIAAGVSSWSVLVALLGTGQEIHVGEEAGLELWRLALNQAVETWAVYGPGHLAGHFHHHPYHEIDELHLSVPIRCHTAEQLSLWVDAVLNGQQSEAARLADDIADRGYSLLGCRDIEILKQYVRKRYEGDISARYGLLQSSRARILQMMEIPVPSVRDFPAGLWYNEDPDCAFSCCQLSIGASEFTSQGLELNFGILVWGEDLSRIGGDWVTINGTRGARDPHRLRLNSYRVLLTRGRDGIGIYCDRELVSDETWEFLLSCGLEQIA